jgi:hypothetical protein
MRSGPAVRSCPPHRRQVSGPALLQMGPAKYERLPLSIGTPWPKQVRRPILYMNVWSTPAAESGGVLRRTIWRYCPDPTGL